MLYTYYGDDFTGSTDVLETLAEAGIDTALFLRSPTSEDLSEFANVQAVGIAGDSRSRSPEWMNSHLPTVFATLKQLGAPITHYKTCSTFDSAPHIGNIGRAIEIGIDVFAPRFVPIVVGAPHLGRYVVFGQLFAAANGSIYRIDRHPTMSRHPVTPMLEAELRAHLAAQTALSIASLDINHLNQESLETILSTRPPAILFDTLDERSIRDVGNMIWQQAGAQTLFAAGSSGLTHSLVSAWRMAGLIPDMSAPPAAPSAEQVLVLSGSCSPVTASQISWALANGFYGLKLDPETLLCDSVYSEEALSDCLTHIRTGHNVILYTALGPISASSVPYDSELGVMLGRLLRAILEQSNLRRAVICGGDTSSHAMQQLDVLALTWLAPITPGAPLCRAHSPGTPFHLAEFILKGGQIGSHDFFRLALGKA